MSSPLENPNQYPSAVNVWTMPASDLIDAAGRPQYVELEQSEHQVSGNSGPGRHAIAPFMTEETTVIPRDLITAIDQEVRAEGPEEPGALSPFFTPAAPTVEASGVNMFPPVELTSDQLDDLANAPVSSLLGGLNQHGPDADLKPERKQAGFGLPDFWASVAADIADKALPALPPTSETPIEIEQAGPDDTEPAQQPEQQSPENWEVITVESGVPPTPEATPAEEDAWQPSSTAVMFAGKVATAPFDTTGIPAFKDQLMPPAWTPDASEFEPVRILS